MVPNHLFQDAQHILTLYFSVACSSALRNSVRDGQLAPLSNYSQASRAADSIIDRLEATIMGSGLGVVPTELVDCQLMRLSPEKEDFCMVITGWHISDSAQVILTDSHSSGIQDHHCYTSHRGP